MAVVAFDLAINVAVKLGKLIAVEEVKIQMKYSHFIIVVTGKVQDYCC